MKTNRDLEIMSSPACSPQYTVRVPKGAKVKIVGGAGGGYALEKPQDYGVNYHDATYYYFWLPNDAVDA